MCGGIWMLLWMLKWLHGDGTGILSFLFLCSHICLSLQICFEHSAIDVRVRIASKYLNHLPSAGHCCSFLSVEDLSAKWADSMVQVHARSKSSLSVWANPFLGSCLYTCLHLVSIKWCPCEVLLLFLEHEFYGCLSPLHMVVA